MFCRQCGTELSSDDKFCFKCGTSTSAVDSVSSPTVRSAGEASLLSFGPPENRWWLPFVGRRAFPKGFEWMGERNTLFLCHSHLVLIQGDEKRSAALDVIGAMGLVGGLVGAVRGMKDSFLNRKFELSSEQAQRLYDDQLLVWCKKSDAQIWRYHEKPWMLIRSTSEQLYCPFNSKGGVLHACAVLWCTAEYTGHGKGDIEGFGVRIVDVGHDIPEKKVPEVMAASRSTLPE